MLGHDEEPAIRADSYIDALLTARAGQPAVLPAPAAMPPAQLRHAIELLDRHLPRFHPSFAFEESLVARLRSAAAGPDRGVLVELPVGPVDAARWLSGDRRLLLGGAIASGVSIAGAAAMLAWLRRDRTRPPGGMIA
ncbi:MAG TPA: hypothetical protein VNW68_03875 [Candidatus Limnocylindria bacterium]|jgi:hypothetical protein|nr:hypothetical protein [Candidatus Limnocylindria bacterium]